MNNKNTIFSQITNVTLNKDNVDLEKISDVSRILSDVFEEFEAKGIKTKEIWEKIDHCIVLTILSCYKFLTMGEESQCPKIVYSRCFQILGFDILLDEKLNPHVLEVNYRPSLDFYRGIERRRVFVDSILNAEVTSVSIDGDYLHIGICFLN